MGVGPRPHPEFFTIVKHREGPVPEGRYKTSQAVERFAGILKWNRITQSLADGKQGNSDALLFGDEGPFQFIFLPTGHHEMTVIHQGIVLTIVVQNFGQMRFPNTFREPQAPWGRIESLLEIMG